MLSKLLRRSDPTLTSSGSEEMPTPGVGGPTRGWCGRRERRDRQGALRATPDRSPAGGQHLSSGPGNAARVWAGAAPPGQRSGAGGAGGRRLCSQAPALHPQVHSDPSSRFSPALCPWLSFPGLPPLHSYQVLWVKNPGRRWGWGWGRPRGIIVGRNHARAPGHQAGLGILSCADRRTLGEAPPSLGPGTPLWGQLGWDLPLSKPLPWTS